MTELLVLLAIAAFAQVPERPAPAPLPANPTASARQAMEASLEKQKASISKQTQGALPQASQSSWFTNPWPSRPVEPLGPAPLQALQPVQEVLPVAQCDPLPADQVKPLIRSAALREGLKEDLLTAVMQQESAFKPCAVSPKGAQGLMQLVKDPFDPQDNITGGARLLKQLLDKYKGDVKLALGAYNAGQGAVDRQGGVPPFQETQDYVTNILSKLIY